MEYVVYTVRSGRFRGQYRWYLRAANGRKIANGGESYHNLDDALHAIGLVKGSTAAPIAYPAEG